MASVPFMVAQAALDLELPPIVEATRLQRGAVETWGLRLAEGPDAWLRIASPRIGLASLLHEQAALSLGWAHQLDHLPEGYRAVGIAGGGAAAHRALVGTSATALAPDQVEGFTEQVGRWLGAIDLRFEHGGTFADGHRFLARGTSWGHELELELARIEAVLAAAGARVPDGRLGAWIAPALEARPDGFTLVHRDLAPHRLWAHQGQLVGVFGWERAWIADALYQWAPLVLQPVPVLAALVRGAGATVVHDPALRPVLRGYAALEVLARLANQVEGVGPGGHPVVAWAQELALDELERLERLDSHLDAVRDSAGLDRWPGWRADPVQLLLRRYLRLLAERERRHDDRLELGLAAVLLGATLDEGELRERWLANGEQVLRTLERTWVGSGPVLDRPAVSVSPFEPGAVAVRADLLWARALAQVPCVDPAVHTGLAMRLAVLTARDRAPADAPRARIADAMARAVVDPDSVDRDQLREDYDLCTGFDPLPSPTRARLARTISDRLAPVLLFADALEGVEGLPAGPLDLVQALLG